MDVIVTLKSKITPDNISILKQYGKIVHISFRANSVIITPFSNNVREIASLPWVEEVAVDSKITSSTTDNLGTVPSTITNTYVTQYLGLKKYMKLAIPIAVLDTGIYDNSGVNVKHITIIPDATQDKDHGTWIAYTIGGSPSKTEINGKSIMLTGVVPGTPIIDAPVITEQGYTTMSIIIKALDAVADAGAKVINMSLSAPELCSKAMNNMLKSLANEKIIMVTAGGNYGNDAPIGCPANSPYTIAVGSVGISSNGPFVSDFSPIGVDICAPGGNITPEQLIMSRVKDKTISMAGTSMSTPFVTAAAAIIKDKSPYADVNSVRYVLFSTALERHLPPSPLLGYGILDYSVISSDAPLPSKELNPSKFYPTVYEQSELPLLLIGGVSACLLSRLLKGSANSKDKYPY